MLNFPTYSNMTLSENRFQNTYVTFVYSICHQYYSADWWLVETTSSLHLCLNGLSLETWPDRWRPWTIAYSEPVLSAFSPVHLLKCSVYMQLLRWWCPPSEHTSQHLPCLWYPSCTCTMKTARMPLCARKTPTFLTYDDIVYVKNKSCFVSLLNKSLI